jgi:hypothetical protein
MELVATLRMLWRRRLLVGVGALAAVGVFVLVGGAAGKKISIASTGVVLDTPESQLIHPAPRGAETLAWRAGLLADLLTTRSATSELARAAGVKEHELVVMDPELAAPPVPASLPRNAAQAAAATPEPHVVLVSFDQVIPIVTIEAAAPDRRTAVRLASAAAEALKAGAPSADPTATPAFVVESVGPVRVKQAGGEARTAMALAMSVFVLAIWCGAIAVLSSLRAILRRSGSPGLAPG